LRERLEEIKERRTKEILQDQHEEQSREQYIFSLGSILSMFNVDD